MCVRLAGQSVDGHVVVRRVANVSIFVSGRNLHGFAYSADVFHRVVAEPRQVKILEDVHHLGQHDAATGRLVGRQVITSIIECNGFVSGSGVIDQIIVGQQSAVGSKILGYTLRDGTLVENVRPLVSDGSKRACQVWVVDPISDTFD